LSCLFHGCSHFVTVKFHHRAIALFDQSHHKDLLQGSIATHPAVKTITVIALFILSVSLWRKPKNKLATRLSGEEQLDVSSTKHGFLALTVARQWRIYTSLAQCLVDMLYR
jgi:hypothetical protein